MMNFDIKRKINTLRDILVGKVPDPKAQVEQITIALIYKFMDDMDLQGVEFGGSRVFFAGEYEKYAFSQIMLSEHSAQEKLNLYAEGMDKMVENSELPKLFRDILRNTYIPYRDPDTLARFLKEIAEFSYDNSEDLGNAFEYLLSIMGSQGDAGQFRTPRHIIDMMVEIVAPQKNETILDPACGTAGFLISAYNYINNHNLDENGNSTLTPDDRTRMTENFEGYDISPDMVRLSRVNMYLHGFATPKIHEYDTLTSLDRWDDSFDVILANPPFMTPKGGINPHNRYRVGAKRAEVLFVDYIVEHLNTTGRAAIIVPEGVVFQSQSAYKKLRTMLVDEGYLYGVISLPSGVFNPYSGVKTSILLIDRTLAKEEDSILFVKLNNDGYDLGAQRREIKGSEIPDVINIFKEYQAGKDITGRKNVVLALKSEIAKQEYVLVGERYLVKKTYTGKCPSVPLKEVCTFLRGLTYSKEDESSIPTKNVVLRANNIDVVFNTLNLQDLKYLIEDKTFDNSKKIHKNDILLCASSGSKTHLGKVSFIDNDMDFYFGGFMAVLRHNDKINPKYLYYCLTSQRYKSFISELLSGANINNIRSKDLLEFNIPLPTLIEQDEIVAELERHQKIIDGARQVFDNYRPTIQINSDWQYTTLQSICELQSGGTPLRNIDEYWNSADYPWYTSGELNSIYTTAPLNYISEKGLMCSSTKIFPKGSLLIGMYDTAAFKMSILDRDAAFNQAICGVKPNSEINMIFLLLFLMSNRNEYLKMRMGARQRNLTKAFIANLKVPCPPLEEQNILVEKIMSEISIVESNRRLIEIFEKKIQDKLSEVWGE